LAACSPPDAGLAVLRNGAKTLMQEFIDEGFQVIRSASTICQLV
jgi:hypothetical protein